MKRLAAFVPLLLLVASTPGVAAIDWSAVDKAMGRAGQEQPGGVHRYNSPRTDLRVTLDGVPIKPGFALGSWTAFLPMGNDAVVMGDLVLTQDEVNPVLSRLLAGGLTITALHNHLLRSQPATMYMHIEGRGDPARLAATVRQALAASRTPPPSPPAAAGPIGFDTAAVDSILRSTGKANGPVYQFSFPRRNEVREGEMVIPPSMGLATAINFEATGGGKAAITGDFVMTADEVDKVLRALRAGGVEVTALHNHMRGEEPRLFFMHFWANGDPGRLASALRNALDKMSLR